MGDIHMIKVAICDDEKEYIDKISKIVSDIEDVKIYTYDSGYKILNILEEFDIFILDIEMPGISGMNLAHIIREKRKEAIIIFLTNYDSYVFDGYEVGAFRYLSKVRMDQKLLPAVKKAIDIVNDSKRGCFLSLSADKKTIIKINLKDVIYLEKSGKEVVFNTIHNEKIAIRATLGQIGDELDRFGFTEVRKGVLANIAYIERIDGQEVALKNNIVLYTSRSRFEPIRKAMLHYWSK